MEIYIGMCAAALLWVMYMATFRTRDFLDLAKAEEERRKARHERMTRTAGGAIRTGLTLFKMFRP